MGMWSPIVLEAENVFLMRNLKFSPLRACFLILVISGNFRVKLSCQFFCFSCKRFLYKKNVYLSSIRHWFSYRVAIKTTIYLKLAEAFQSSNSCLDWYIIIKSMADTNQRMRILTPDRGAPWKSILSSMPVWAICMSAFAHCWVWYLECTGFPAYFKAVLNMDFTETGILGVFLILGRGVEKKWALKKFSILGDTLKVL